MGLSNQGRSAAFVCLMYHNVYRDPVPYARLSPAVTSYFVRQDAFQAQLSELASQGGRFLGPEDLAGFYQGAARAEALAGWPVLLTFDDGWAGSVEYAGPVLERHDARALLFVTTEFVGRPHFLDRWQLGQLSRERFQVGSHGRTHRMLNLLNDAEVREELAYSKAFLEDALGYAVETLSVPSGAAGKRVVRIAAEVGYRFVFTSEVHVNRPGTGPLDIGRVAVKHDTSVKTFRRYVRQCLTRERLRRWVLNFPKRLLGLRRYERWRRRLLGEAPGQVLTHQS
jgi:peptidoglycan/xylan/chitin deacetylase (PgdA/CDA1 family)